MKTTKFIALIIAITALTGCKSYNLERELDEDKKTFFEIQLEENLKLIANPPDFVDEDHPPPYDYYVKAALSADELGKIRLAEDLYLEAMENYPNFEVPYNNLGRLYEELGWYDEAIEQYMVLVEKFGYQRYYFDITWAYIKSEDRKNAEKYFNAWQRAEVTTDENTQEAIKKLREKEKENK